MEFSEHFLVGFSPLCFSYWEPFSFIIIVFEAPPLENYFLCFRKVSYIIIFTILHSSCTYMYECILKWRIIIIKVINIFYDRAYNSHYHSVCESPKLHGSHTTRDHCSDSFYITSICILLQCSFK